MPRHIGAIVHTVEWAVKEVGPENMEPGDVILHNDPYRGGCHLPEFMTLKPCFYDGRVVAYAANIAHMTDIGGMVPAAFGDTRNIFQEGIRIRRSRSIEGTRRLRISSTSSLPTCGRRRCRGGDLKAMIGSTYLAERRVVELIERYGVDVFSQLAEQIKDISELLVRRAISAMPDGEYTAEGYLEDDGVVAGKRYKFVATLVIRGDEIIVDYTGSDPQAEGAINQSFGTTASATYATIFHMIDDQHRQESRRLPADQHSCSTGNGRERELPRVLRWRQFRHVSEHDGPAFCGVFAFSDRSTAADGGTSGLLGFYGNSADSGHPFVLLHIEGMGWGARADADGNDAIVTKNGNCLKLSPARCSRFAIRCASSHTG